MTVVPATGEERDTERHVWVGVDRPCRVGFDGVIGGVVGKWNYDFWMKLKASVGILNGGKGTSPDRTTTKRERKRTHQ